jgi:hypothetical protein
MEHKWTTERLVQHLKDVSVDSGGAGVWTPCLLTYVLQDCGEGFIHRDECQVAFDRLVDEGVMERVGRDGYQVTEEYLLEHGSSVEELGT